MWAGCCPCVPLIHSFPYLQRCGSSANFLKVHRACIFLNTTFQLIRCIDPFCALGILPYTFVRFLQLSVTISLYFQYSCTTYIVMDTLYACALKRTPSWLAIVVCILPVAEFVWGLAVWQQRFAQQWNLTTYNVSGIILIRILRRHQQTGTAAVGEDISGSKSASPFDVVIAKTMRGDIASLSQEGWLGHQNGSASRDSCKNDHY